LKRVELDEPSLLKRLREQAALHSDALEDPAVIRDPDSYVDVDPLLVIPDRLYDRSASEAIGLPSGIFDLEVALQSSLQTHRHRQGDEQESGPSMAGSSDDDDSPDEAPSSTGAAARPQRHRIPVQPFRPR
jgi:hypothetical protein